MEGGEVVAIGGWCTAAQQRDSDLGKPRARRKGVSGYGKEEGRVRRGEAAMNLYLRSVRSVGEERQGGKALSEALYRRR